MKTLDSKGFQKPFLMISKAILQDLYQVYKQPTVCKKIPLIREEAFFKGKTVQFPDQSLKKYFIFINEKQ
jgi:hypothetical protein